MYVIQASALTKLRLPEWQRRCLDNPELLRDSAPFTVHIPRASGSVTLVHKKITPAWELIKKSRDRMTDEDEITPLVNWLTDESCRETDIWGVVSIKVEENVADTIMSLMMEGDATKVAEMVQDTQAAMRKDFTKAFAIADERVMRACGTMFNVVKSTIEDMKKNNKGQYSPSFAEALCFDVLKDVIKKRREPEMRAQELVERAMNELAPDML